MRDLFGCDQFGEFAAAEDLRRCDHRRATGPECHQGLEHRCVETR